MSLLSFADELTQPAGRRYVEQKLGAETWLTVHSYVDAPMYDGAVFSALIPNDRVEHALKDPGWDLLVGDGLPDFSVGRDGRRYHSWTTGHGILPLVLVRGFHIPIEGVQRVELLEEFRLFHDLAYVPRRQEYLEVSSSTPTVIARRVDGRMEVRRTAIRQFLAAKEMHLALFFHKTQMSDELVDSVPTADRDIRVVTSDLIYELAVCPWHGSTPGKSFSKFIGKRMVPPLPLEAVGVRPYGEVREYADFIVGLDDADAFVTYSCEPDGLKNPSSPGRYAPIHFRRDVLAKYYADSSLYTVGDGRLHCGSLWSLRMDNDHPDRVIVHLVDLGYLPYDEQVYWKSYNIEPEGGLSQTAWERGVRGNFADTSEPALALQQTYTTVNRLWEAELEWPLFLPLSKDDRHNLEGLRVPLNDSAAEFDGQVQALTKAMVDSLNEKAVRAAAAAAGVELDGNVPGISKLSALLDATGFDATEHGFDADAGPVPFMRGLQKLRSSGSAHRKGKTYAKVAEGLGIEDRGRVAVMRELLVTGTRVLNVLLTHADEIARRGAPDAAK
ncbi:MAG: hypothetical protein SangKO_099650 [Sandaracinaceae bacterium]